jgi:hypothetical protein
MMAVVWRSRGFRLDREAQCIRVIRTLSSFLSLPHPLVVVIYDVFRVLYGSKGVVMKLLYCCYVFSHFGILNVQNLVADLIDSWLAREGWVRSSDRGISQRCEGSSSRTSVARKGLECREKEGVDDDEAGCRVGSSRCDGSRRVVVAGECLVLCKLG